MVLQVTTTYVSFGNVVLVTLLSVVEIHVNKKSFVEIGIVLFK